MELTEIKDSFEFFDDWEDKYRFILEIGRDLPEMDASHRIEDNLILGCQSQVWLTHTSDADGGLTFSMDSDAHIVRGLIAVVLVIVDGRQASEIKRLDIENVFEQLDLLAHLSVTRGNGLRAMVARIKEVAAQAPP